MTTREEATKVLLVCKANDPARFPNYNDDIADAWAEQFSHSGLPLALLVAAAKQHYAESGQVFTAKDVIDRAHKLRRPTTAEEQDRQLAALAAKGDSKAACDDCPHHQHSDRCPSCDCSAGQVALQSSPAAKQRVLDITAYAVQFGITRREARLRMQARDMAATSYEQALAYRQRTAAPPAPMPEVSSVTDAAGGVR